MDKAEAQQLAEAALRDRIADSAAERHRVLDAYASQEWSQLAPVEQTVGKLLRQAPPDVAADYQESHARLEAMATPTGLEAMEDVAEIERQQEEERLGQVVFEQIIGQSEIMPVRFVYKASKAARSIGRIVLRDFRAANGTGFLVSPRLLLTNFHVLPDKTEARANLVQFGVVGREDGSTTTPIEFCFQPDVLFLQSPIEDFDFTLVAVEPVNREGVTLQSFGWCPLIGDVGKEHPGEQVNVVHHPLGNPKQVSLRENTVVLILDQFLHYMTDTMRGSSGSPVFNDEWEVVALHHAGRDITDLAEIERYRNALGSNLPAGVDPDQATVSVNEGARISKIVARLREFLPTLTSSEAELLNDALLATPTPAGTEGFISDSSGSATRVAAGSVTVNINVSGTPSTTTTTRSVGVSTSPGLELFRGETQKSVLRGLGALQRRREGLYLPPADEVDDRIESYYGDLPGEVANGTVDSGDLYDRLNELIGEEGTLTIATSFPESLEAVEAVRRADLESVGVASDLILEGAFYDRSRAHLYTWVDLRPSRMLGCVYTDAVISPEQLLLKDLVSELGFGSELPRRFRNNQFLNCEHIVPQAWFGREKIGVADMHHLITADGQANNFRSDSVYTEIAGDAGAQTRPDGLPEYIEDPGRKLTTPKRFEPARNKGLVARATLYFLVAHKGKIDDSRYDDAGVEMLKAWAMAEPPGEYERHRNEAICDVQGNRNPLIDFPDWVEAIDFTKGLS